MTLAELLPAKALLRPDEVAGFFSVTVQTVYNWYNSGDLEGIALKGKTLRITRESVVRMVEDGMQYSAGLKVPESENRKKKSRRILDSGIR